MPPRRCPSRQHELPASYDDWLRDAQDGCIAFMQAGFIVHRVDVDLKQLMTWCERHRRRLDAQAMMYYSDAVVVDLLGGRIVDPVASRRRRPTFRPRGRDASD